MGYLSAQLAGDMAEVLFGDLKDYLQRKGVSVALEIDELSEPSADDPSADVLLRMTFGGKNRVGTEGRMFVTYLSPGLYHVSLQVGASAYRSQIVESLERDGQEVLSRNYTHHLWTHVVREFRRSVQRESVQTAVV